MSRKARRDAKHTDNTLDDILNGASTPIIIRDAKDYSVIQMNAPAIELFEGNDFFLWMTEDGKHLKDMNPISYRLIDTPEGKFYAKLTLYGVDPRP